MKSYLGLVSEYEKVHKKKSRISVLCIALSVCLVTTIFSMADMGLQAQKNYFIKTNGNYHILIRDISEQDAELIAERIDIAESGWVYQGSTGVLQNTSVFFAGAEENTISELTEMNMAEGIYPTTTNEALLNETALEQLELTIGDTVSVKIQNGSQKEYKITGALEDMGSLLKADAYGMVLTEEGFRQIENENAKDGISYRIQFKDGVNIQAAADEIKEAYHLENDQVAENTVLLGIMGQSENNVMQSLYLVAGILVLLVLAAGTVMISASFNTNVLERTQFYGLLRCLGASKAQVRHFVIRQGLRQSFRGVPIGLMIGQIITWIACLLLKQVSSMRFSGIPLFKFSVLGLAAGAVVGFMIVLFASLSPAKKASKVSPVTAVNGNTQTFHTAKAVNTKTFRVETGMGISHAMSVKKNVLLMTCSFAISIVMFLSFQVMVTFLNQGMPALEASAADLSITTENGIKVDRKIFDEMQVIPEVKQVYGRMTASKIPTVSGIGSGNVTLVSYDDVQFRWAKNELIEGKINSVQESQNSILVAYHEGMEWNTGDTVTLSGDLGEREVTVAGIVSAVYESTGLGNNNYVICSEKLFTEITGYDGYSVVDVQLTNKADDATVAQIRRLLPNEVNISDKRLSNQEAQSSYYTGAIFIYGFLIIIALITVFNIFNSMNASVSARTKQYGIMRSIGMSTKQVRKMIAAEAMTYAILGCLVGCVFGIPLNRLMFVELIAGKWGLNWHIPFAPLALIVVLCVGSAVIAIRHPIKEMERMSIVDTIKIQQ